MAPPTSLAQIAQTEVEIGASFPGAFKLRMCRSNGGEVTVVGETWWLFPFRDNTNRETIRRSAEDLSRETQRAVAAGLGFPAEALAIAHNGAGDLLFLRREGTRIRDEVWVYRLHGEEITVALDDVAELWERES